MKNTLQHLLVIMALGLCGLCTWQWYNQAQQHKAMTALTQTNSDQVVEIQRYTNSIAAMDRQIAQMDAHLTELKETIQTNRTEILTLRSENQRLAGTLEQYNTAMATHQAQVKQVVAQRDDLLGRLNAAIQDRNDVVAKYNKLVKRFEEFQAAPAKPDPLNKK